MKKLFALFFTTVLFISSSFALNLAVGGRLMLGGNIGADYSGFEGMVGGGGAYLNLDFIGGFGAQGEVNVVTNKIEVSTKDSTLTTTDYQIIDFPFMLWYNLNLSRIAIGGGAGINFSSFSNENIGNRWNVGAAAGLNFKVFFTDHIGLVLGAHSVFDFLPTVTVTSSGKSRTYKANAPDYTRKSIYGTAGVEYHF